ncbi:MAG TPA: hypothetical protein VHT03_10445 [Rhizomicrobium sp.]|jgi:hypothetical protein|nr:hypothetical protein [Rhizomicrobium sp.]
MLPFIALTALMSSAAIKTDVPADGATIFPTNIAFGEIDPNGKVPTENGVTGAGAKKLGYRTAPGRAESGT